MTKNVNNNEIDLHIDRTVAYTHLRPSRECEWWRQEDAKIILNHFFVRRLTKRSLQVNAYYMTKNEKKSMSERSARASCKLFFFLEKKY